MDSSINNAEIVRLYDDASPELVRVLHRKLGSRQEAEEVAHDAFEKLCGLAGRQDIEDLRKYFFTMANRMALNVLRRRGVENDYLMLQVPITGDDTGRIFDPETITIYQQKLNLTKVALQRLPKKTRHVFLLHRFEGYTYPEIARQLGLSKKSVEYHMNRALTAVLKVTEELA